MQLNISKLTLERIERIARISRREPAEELNSALAMWEQSILSFLPAEKHAVYFDGGLGSQSDIAPATFEVAERKPERKPRNAYVEFTERD